MVELNAKFPKKSLFSDSFGYSVGKRFYKVYRSTANGLGKSAYAFIDKSNGDLFRAASWAQIANYVRGNINDESGLNACEEYGVKTLN